MSTWDIVGVARVVYALFLVVLICLWNPRFQQLVRREDEMVSRLMSGFAAAETHNPGLSNPGLSTADPLTPGGRR